MVASRRGGGADLADPIPPSSGGGAGVVGGRGSNRRRRPQRRRNRRRQATTASANRPDVRAPLSAPRRVRSNPRSRRRPAILSRAEVRLARSAVARSRPAFFSGWRNVPQEGDDFLVGGAAKVVRCARDRTGGKRERERGDGGGTPRELKGSVAGFEGCGPISVRDGELDPSAAEEGDVDADADAEVDAEAREWGASESTAGGDEGEKVNDCNPCRMHDRTKGAVPPDEAEAFGGGFSCGAGPRVEAKGATAISWIVQTTYGYRADCRLLYAAVGEDEDEDKDEIMARARILDEAKDGSLVREAATYLEEVEAHRGNALS